MEPGREAGLRFKLSKTKDTRQQRTNPEGVRKVTHTLVTLKSRNSLTLQREWPWKAPRTPPCPSPSSTGSPLTRFPQQPRELPQQGVPRGRCHGHGTLGAEPVERGSERGSGGRYCPKARMSVQTEASRGERKQERGQERPPWCPSGEHEAWSARLTPLGGPLTGSGARRPALGDGKYHPGEKARWRGDRKARLRGRKPRPKRAHVSGGGVLAAAGGGRPWGGAACAPTDRVPELGPHHLRPAVGPSQLGAPAGLVAAPPSQ